MAEEEPSISLLIKHLQDDDELSQECKELISTLPFAKGWLLTTIHQYQGSWYPPKQLQGLLSCQKHFHADDNDIIIATQPKSGTTWLKALTFSLFNRNKYPIIQNQNHPLITNNPHTLVPFLEIDLYQVKDFVPDLSKFSSPKLFATHMPYVSLPNSVKNSNCKIIYLCRDPKDILISLWHFSNKFMVQNKQTKIPIEVAFEMFCGGETAYGPFWDQILGYWNESIKRPNKIKFVRFEELKINTSFVVKEIAEFIGCPFTKEEKDQGFVDAILKLCSFEYLSNLEINTQGKITPYQIECSSLFRRGEVGDWKNHLTVEQIDKLNTIIELKLGKYGITL